MLKSLRIVDGNRRVGTVRFDNNELTFGGDAEEVFRTLRQKVNDDQKLGQMLMEGWSNGYLYLK